MLGYKAKQDGNNLPSGELCKERPTATWHAASHLQRQPPTASWPGNKGSREDSTQTTVFHHGPAGTMAENWDDLKAILKGSRT